MSYRRAATFGKFETRIMPSDLRRVGELPAADGVTDMREVLRDGELVDRLGADGLAVLSGLDALPSEDWPRIFLVICGALGVILPQSMTEDGQRVREIRYRGGGLDERTFRYSDSRSGGSYHTDGVPMPGRLPDLIALLCIRPAARGGELVFVDSSAALDAATMRMPRLPVVLGRDFHFDQRREDDPTATVTRRIVDRVGGTDQLVYLRDYIESGHQTPGVRPLASEELQAMDILDEVLEDEALHIEGRLSPGQIAISDNHRYVHGRHEFRDQEDASNGRLMLRCWMRTSGGE
jgi:hypothetical protein